jgi:hypothetical protein
MSTLMDPLNSPNAPRDIPRTVGIALGAPRTAVLPEAPNASSAFFAYASYSEGARFARRFAARAMQPRLRRR